MIEANNCQPVLKIETKDLNFEIEYGAEHNLDKTAEIDQYLDSLSNRVTKLNYEIDNLTNQADWLDYTVAVASGVISGLFDSFFVGEFDFKGAKAWSNKSINEYVGNFAKKNGYDGNRLNGQVAFLEGKFKSPTDSSYVGGNAGIWTKSHHLDDWSHHPTPIGWICSICAQFSESGYFSNANGEGFFFDVNKDALVGGSWINKIFAGTINWFGHLVSDVGGSNATAGAGMGIPGPFLSIAKEFSQLPGIRNTSLPKIVNDAFVKNNFDLRSELAVAHELGRQAVPVILNEVIVRTFYFVRRLISQWKQKGFQYIDWRKTLPFNNRTIVRMMTIASGTFVAVDLADAAIRSAISNGSPQNPKFWKDFVLRINFVGIGRFAIAIFSDVKMGIQRYHKVKERIDLHTKMLNFYTAKIFYKQSDMWVAAECAEKETQQLCAAVQKSVVYFTNSISEINSNIGQIDSYNIGLDKNNPGLRQKLIAFLDE